LQAIGQNFIFKDGKLDIQVQEPLLVIRDAMKTETLKKAASEPSILRSANRKDSRFAAVFSSLSG
jgi:hypothetical protein